MSCWKSWNRSLETNTLCKLWQLNSSVCVFIWPSDLLRSFPSHASCAWCRANVCNYPHHPFFSLAPLCAWSLLSSKFSGVMIETSALCCGCFLVEERSYGCAWTKIWSLISLFETHVACRMGCTDDSGCGFGPKVTYVSTLWISAL